MAEIKRTRPEMVKELRKLEHSRKARKLIEHLNKRTKEEAKQVVDHAVQHATQRAVQMAEEREKLYPGRNAKLQERELGLLERMRANRATTQLPTVPPPTQSPHSKTKGPWQALKEIHEDSLEAKALSIKQNTMAVCVFNSISSVQYVARAA